MKRIRGRVPDRGDWFRRFHEPPAGGPLLLCFPHAGGSAAGYLPLSAALAPAAEVQVVQYPGRQDRILEPAVADLRELADRVVAALRPRADRSTVLFGHSMGALLAYEVALRLERRARAGGPPGPVGLIVSGRVAPSIRVDRRLHLLDDDGLVAVMSELAGTPADLLADSELLAEVLPTLRADFTAVETYSDTSTVPLACPVAVYRGAGDGYVSPEGARRWAGHTTAAFSESVFDGGHFYIDAQTEKVARCVTRDLTTFSATVSAATAVPLRSGPASW